MWSEGLVLPDTVMDIVADQIMDTQEESQAHESENTFHGEKGKMLLYRISLMITIMMMTFKQSH